MPIQFGSPAQTYETLSQYKLKVTIDPTQAAWNTVGNHRVFTVTGLVRIVHFIYITNSLTSGGAPTISWGVTGSMAYIDVARVHTLYTTGNWLLAGSGPVLVNPTAGHVLAPAVKGDLILSAAQGNVGYAIATAALTGGAMTAYAFWTPISDDGLVTAGNGGAM